MPGEKWYKGSKFLPDSIPMEAIIGLVEPVVRFVSRPGVPPNTGYRIRADVLPPLPPRIAMINIEGIKADMLADGAVDLGSAAVIGSLAADRLIAGEALINLAEIGTLSANDIVTGTLSAIDISGVRIVGSTLSTDDGTGAYVTIGETDINKVEFFSSLAFEATPGELSIVVLTVDTEATGPVDYGILTMGTPTLGAALRRAYIQLYSEGRYDENSSFQAEDSRIRLVPLSGTDAGSVTIDRFGIRMYNDLNLVDGHLHFGTGAMAKWNGTNLDVGRNSSDDGWVPTKTGALTAVTTPDATAITIQDGTNNMRLRMYAGKLQYSYNSGTWTNV